MFPCMQQIIDFILNTVDGWGYWGVFILMVVESSFIPFPSEVVIIPAGYLAYQGKMNLAVIIFLGTAGSLVGALVNYYLSIFIGRAVIIRFGKYFLITEDKLEKSEEFFKKHGSFSTFTGRLIPVIRQLISIPAGLSRMNLWKFSVFTSLGAGIWVIILALLGYFIGHSEELLKQYTKLIVLSLLIIIAIAVVIYVYRHKKNQKKAENNKN